MKQVDFFEYHDNFARNNGAGYTLNYGNELDFVPLVSITIPTFRRPKLLKEAVKSVLQQNNFNDYEIVIVDNDDERIYTEQIVKFLTEMSDIRIRYYINDKNLGVFGNWNRCIELAHGKWMTILCDDDLLFSNYLSVLTQELEQDKSLNRVECRYQIFSDSQRIKATPKQLRRYNLSRRFLGEWCNVSYNMYLFGCFTAPHTQLYKRDLAYKIGGFNPDYAPISDYVFNAMYLYNYPGGVFINQYLCGYRWSVNESQRKIVKVGICRWNRAFRFYLLDKRFSFNNWLLNNCLNYIELNLLGKKNSLARELLVLIMQKIVFLLQIRLRVPSQIG